MTLEASLSLVRGLYMISMTHYDVLLLLFIRFYIQKHWSLVFVIFLFYILILFWFSTYFFDNITLCTNLQNVTLSNMSHLVYITLYDETDGVILSRLDCQCATTFPTTMSLLLLSLLDCNHIISVRHKCATTFPTTIFPFSNHCSFFFISLLTLNLCIWLPNITMVEI